MGGGGAPGDGAGAPAADALSSGSPASGQAATAGAGVVQPAPILATKLYVPQPRADVGKRQHSAPELCFCHCFGIFATLEPAC